MASLRSDWPALRILPVHGLNGRQLFAGVVPSACRSACAVPFPGEPRANFRCPDLAAELGTPGFLWEVCGPGAGLVTRAAGLPGLARDSRRAGPGPSGRGRRGAHCWEVLGVSRAPAPATRSLASQLCAGEAAGDGARGSGRVCVPACRIQPSDPGESLALRASLLGL